MAVSAVRVSVTSVATSLESPDGAGVAGSSTAIRNLDASVTVYLGGSGVTTATGYPLDAGTQISIDNESSDVLYGIVATGTANVAVLRTGV